MQTQPLNQPLMRGVFMALALPACCIAAFLAVLSGPALYLAIVSAACTIGWNLVVVTLFQCTPVTFWQALVLLLIYRVGTAPFRRK